MRAGNLLILVAVWGGAAASGAVGLTRLLGDRPVASAAQMRASPRSPDDRRAFAAELQQRWRAAGSDLAVEASGADASTLHIRGAAMTRALSEQMMAESGGEWRGMGFRTVVFAGGDGVEWRENTLGGAAP